MLSTTRGVIPRHTFYGVHHLQSRNATVFEIQCALVVDQSQCALRNSSSRWSKQDQGTYIQIEKSIASGRLWYEFWVPNHL